MSYRVVLRELLNSTRNDNIVSKNNQSDVVPNTQNLWKSPIPYLFGSLALMLLLISAALILLVFSYRRHSGAAADDKKSPPPPSNPDDEGLEQQIVVIMAGDEAPTYIATPVVAIAMPTANVCSCGGGGGGGSSQHTMIKV